MEMLDLCLGKELWSTFPEFANPDKLNITLPDVPLQPKALSAPVTTCVLAKLWATCSCSNTFVIDIQKAQATMTPSLPSGWS